MIKRVKDYREELTIKDTYKKYEDELRCLVEEEYGVMFKEEEDRAIKIETVVGYKPYVMEFYITEGTIIVIQVEGVHRYGVYTNRYGNREDYLESYGTVQGKASEESKEGLIKIINKLEDILRDYREETEIRYRGEEYKKGVKRSKKFIELHKEQGYSGVNIRYGYETIYEMKDMVLNKGGVEIRIKGKEIDVEMGVGSHEDKELVKWVNDVELLWYKVEKMII